jgi:hypothetical protein
MACGLGPAFGLGLSVGRGAAFSPGRVLNPGPVLGNGLRTETRLTRAGRVSASGVSGVAAIAMGKSCTAMKASLVFPEPIQTVSWKSARRPSAISAATRRRDTWTTEAHDPGALALAVARRQGALLAREELPGPVHRAFDVIVIQQADQFVQAALVLGHDDLAMLVQRHV